MASQITSVMTQLRKSIEQEGYLPTPNPRIVARESFESIAYSDGHKVEDELLRILKKTLDVSVLSAELQLECKDWVSTYHFSRNRSNLLRPFRDSLRGRILELGAGCGAVTRYLGEVASDVIAVEASLKRCEINAERVRDLGNVTIVASELSDFQTREKFDTVVVVGVLEYAALFSQSQTPHEDFLAKVISFLKPGGRALLAIENKLGLKYFAGAPEDHIGKVMFGVEGRYSERGVKTFSRAELLEMVIKAGFGKAYVHAPMPDHKIVRALVSSEGLSSPSFNSAELASQLVFSDPQIPQDTKFDLRRAWESVGTGRLDADLANSFLLEAVVEADGESSLAGNLAYWYGGDRKPEFLSEKVFTIDHEKGALVVRASRLSDRSPTGLTPSRFSQTTPIDSTYLPGPTYAYRFRDLLERENWELEELVSEICKFFELAGAWAIKRGLLWPVDEDWTALVDGYLVDLIPQNVKHINPDEVEAYDQEWQFKGELPLGYLAFRTILAIFMSTPARRVCKGVDGDISFFAMVHKVAIKLGLAENQLEAFFEFEQNLQETVSIKPLGARDLRNSLDYPFSTATADKDAQLADIEASLSWRITKPLRFLGKLLVPRKR